MAETAETSTNLEGWRLGVVIASLFFGSFLIALDTNIVNVAIPRISTDFHALDDVLWYGTAYLLTITAFQPIYGSIYKFFNTTVVYRLSILTFEVGSILCAAAKNSSMFVAGRAIAGFGAAGLLQGALSVITQVVPLEQRPMYMGIVISVFGITVCIGPPLGGVFTEHISWRWCFWINLPIGAVVILVLSIFLKIKESPNEYRGLPYRQKLQRMDPIGCVLFIGAVCCFLLALQWGGQTRPWNSPTVIGLLVSSAALTGIFIFVQIRLKDAALIPLAVLSKRSIWTGSLALFSLGSSTYLNAFFLPFYFQAVHGIKPLDSGVDLIPYLLPQIVAMAIVGVFVKTWGHYVPWMLVGELISIVGQALLTQIDLHTTTIKWASYMVLAGLGSGMATNLPYTAVQVTLPEKDVPTGNAIAVLFYQLGGAFSISLAQTVTISTIINHVSKRLPHLSSAAVLKAGAAGQSSLTTSQDELYILREIWSTAISRAMILCVALLAISVPFTLGMEWLNAKRVAAARAQISEDENTKESSNSKGVEVEDVKEDVQGHGDKDEM